ncbi:DNA-binding protein [uncultured Photobacterium sp.]|uniref:DNA-binding protein n=1 Tax=uncultured Photobacterium sp. TaxID=173973 RepID=UPI00260F7DE3|nr:DNA-binding protein [uncultured Photobacterium sp.]
MVAPKVSEEIIFELCNNIVSQGEKPTTIRLHKLLGAGSFSTIQKHLRAWEESEAGQEAKQAQLPDEVTLPQAGKDALEGAMKILWAAAKESTEATMKVHQQTVELKWAELEQLAEEVLTANEQQAEKLLDLGNTINNLNKELESRAVTISKLEAKNEGLEEKLKGINEAHQGDLDTKDEEIEGLNKQLESAGNTESQLRDEIDQLRDDLKQANKNHNDEITEHGKTAKSLSQSQIDLTAEKEKLESAKKENGNLQQLLDAEKDQNSQLQKKLVKLQSVERDLAEAQGKLAVQDVMANNLEDTKQTVSDLRYELNMTRERETNLSSTLKMYTDDLAKSRDDLAKSHDDLAKSRDDLAKSHDELGKAGSTIEQLTSQVEELNTELTTLRNTDDK